jgi:hypothetical protein
MKVIQDTATTMATARKGQDEEHDDGDNQHV